eukprot:12370129-Alexandrium_andersonii.AAC.1
MHQQPRVACMPFSDAVFGLSHQHLLNPHTRSFLAWRVRVGCAAGFCHARFDMHCHILTQWVVGVGFGAVYLHTFMDSAFQAWAASS